MFFVCISGYKKTEVGLNSKHSNGGSLDRYTADPNQRGGQARADIIRPRPTPCKQLIHHLPSSNPMAAVAVAVQNNINAGSNARKNGSVGIHNSACV